MKTFKKITLTILSIVLVCLCTGGCEKKANSGIDGIDVSNHQGAVNWKKAAECLSENSFVYIKCTEGATYTDRNYKKNADGAKKQGILVGGYHYFRMTSSAHKQFENFKKALNSINLDLIPMVDVETSDGKPKKELQDSLYVFLNLLEKEYGKKPMIYGTQRSYNTYCAPKFNTYPLYIGRYGNNAPMISGPSHYTIWQYSEAGRISGIQKPVDLCRFHKRKSINDILL